MITWCVVHTQPLKEMIAKQHLLDQGYEVYLPRFKKMCRHARKMVEKLVPLFPRYIFVAINLDTARWRNLNGTRGVSRLLMCDELTPAQVPASIVADLRDQEVAEGVVPAVSLINFVKGDKVRVLDGTFRDQEATFESLDDQSRVKILLTFMGREMNFALPVYAVEAA